MHDCNLQHLAIEVRLLGKYLGSSFKWEFFKSFFLAKIEEKFQTTTYKCKLFLLNYSR